MTCGSCSSTVESTLRAMPGVQTATVKLKQQEAHVVGTCSLAALVEAVEAVGFDAALLHSPQSQSQSQSLAGVVRNGTGGGGGGAEMTAHMADELMWLVASAESGSEHPLARAMVAEAEGREALRGRPLAEPKELKAVPGRGILCSVASRQVA